MRKVRLVSGILFFLAGIFFLYGSFGITGFAIGESVTGTITSLLGIGLLVGGVLTAAWANKKDYISY